MSKARGLADLGNAFNDGALSNRNLIINGAMQVAQRGTSVTGLGDGSVGYKTLDRYRIQKAGAPTARYTMTQDSNAPDGFGSSLKLEVTTADTSVASSDLQYIDQFIEAQNLQQLAYGTSSAKTITLSFYVKCSTAQTFALDLINEDNSRYFNTTYTVSSADTWERKIITFPADTVSGFNNDNGRGLRVRWTLVAGSDFTDGSVSTAWSGTQHTATNHENTWVGATGRTWQITGVQLEVGDTATPFEHPRSYGDMLALCQRYYHRYVSNGDNEGITVAMRYNNGTAYGAYSYPVEMRSAPSFSSSGASTFLYLYSTSAVAPTTLSAGQASKHSAGIAFGAGSASSGQAVQFRCDTAGSWFEFDAEL